MDNSVLIEIENKLAMLPVLEQRMKRLNEKIYDAQDEVRSLLRKFESESLDVENIKKDSFSNTILKLIGKYEGRVGKETQEMLEAKIQYDRAAERVRALNEERNELARQISGLCGEKQLYESELQKREKTISSNITGEKYAAYNEIKNKQEFLLKQLTEIDEAIKAGNRVICTADSAISYLESAESWATYDAWTNGGIISHFAKYEKIDDAQAAFNRLNSQLKDFEKELLDINIDTSFASLGVDSTTRAIDFFFDNIFTDLRVRDKISGDKESVRRLRDKAANSISTLNKTRAELAGLFSEANARKHDLLVSSEG
jgi:hypothetical protein